MRLTCRQIIASFLQPVFVCACMRAPFSGQQTADPQWCYWLSSFFSLAVDWLSPQWSLSWFARSQPSLLPRHSSFPPEKWRRKISSFALPNQGLLFLCHHYNITLIKPTKYQTQQSATHDEHCCFYSFFFPIARVQWHKYQAVARQKLLILIKW